ncbi:formamidopyrimidine-DNA glycosylase [Gracilibacillus halotolerans]|uniref:Formamidopyrimidine-DNA glycosylase n=1 Tax=Gracilibacillus halotolerans TaxID=74386 RepID=A0A841RRB4_9BACI|nr:DNA-formamidopyrimidine glycosylase [Gracilibacillus halotolerans]MBB6513896.1 formamidopyrimidine-DNA glycosylase [Gracilibacillus halotolerans]
MPELPEVETIRQTLKELVIGKKIESVSIHWPKIIQQPEPDMFHQTVVGQTFRDIRRKGKFLLFDLDDFVLVSHLRMEGKYGVFPSAEELMPHTHVIFHFTDDTDLRYRDVRKFGTMHLFKKGEEQNAKPLVQLAEEPISGNFSIKTFTEKVQSSQRCIKNILLDQTVIAGLGNIYVDETLFLAKIHPLQQGVHLTDKDILIIYQSAVETLNKAIKQGGTTIRSYVNSQGQIGMFQQELAVYSKEGEACQVCGDMITKIKVHGRGTHYCPSCQAI